MRTIPSLQDYEDTPHTISYDFLDARQHRMVLNYDDVPHILQYGCHSKGLFDESQKQLAEIGLWRQGKKFFISLHGDDVHNTRLYEKCQPLWQLKFNDKLDGETRAAHKEQWNDRRAQLFDLMIHECMPVLQSLAPRQEHWQTVGDHLHCPSYAFKIVADPKTLDIKVEETTPVWDNMAVYFDYSPKRTKDVGDIPSGTPQYSPYELVDVSEAGDSSPRGDIFDTPHKLRLNDGTICYFFSGECGGDWYEENEIRDESLNTIRAYFEVQKAVQAGKCAYPPGLLTLKGAVIDNDQLQNCESKDVDTWIAGVLLPWMHGAKRLRKLNDPSKEQMTKWRRQILATIEALHELRIAVGAEDMVYADDPFSYVNDHSIIIDSNEDAYLTLTDPVFAERSYDGQSYAKNANLDLEALERVFPGCIEDDQAHARL